MATDANMDWSHQSAPPGYVPAFRSGNMAQLGSSHNANNAYMMRGGASVHGSRSQYGTTSDYHSQSAHPASSLHTGLHVPGPGIEEQFWSQQDDHSRENLLSNGPSAARDEYDHDEPATEADNAVESEKPELDEAAREKAEKRRRALLPRSERRKLCVPRLPPSEPRRFRPFVPLEMEDTTPKLWLMPPIVGSYLMFSNKIVKYNPMPTDVDSVREKLFALKETVLLKNSQEVADYVPHITNIWRRAVQRAEVDEETGVQTEYWHCRTKKAMRVHKDGYTPKGIRNREKKSKTLFQDQDVCSMRVRVISYTKHADHTPFHVRVKGTSLAAEAEKDHDRWGGGPCKCVAEWVHFELANTDRDLHEHTHELEVMDGYKRSEALQVLAKNKCEEGNSFSAVSRWMHEEYGETSKQVAKFEKGDTANAAQAWRMKTRDLVLRDKVPEDSDEMTTMRWCVDAIVEADARSLREALRAVLKDSDALTKTALAILERNKPDVPVEEPREPWKLTEGVTLMDLPKPGATEKMKRWTGICGPPRTAYPPPSSGSPEHRLPAPQPQFTRPAVAGPPYIGPDGRPILAPTAVMAPSQGNTRAGQPQQNVYQQHGGPMPANATPMHGVPLQPRPQGPPAPIPMHMAQPPIEVGYAHPPPQQGSLHPITVSLEVPSCAISTCRQCRCMRRDLAGRRFFFQDSLSTAAQFATLQALLLDPKQLVADSYIRMLPVSQVPLWHHHPALVTVQPPQTGAPPLQRAPGPAPGAAPQLQWVPPPGYSQPPPPPPTSTPAGAPRKPAKRKYTKRARGARSQLSEASTYDQDLPVPIVIGDDDDHPAGDGAAEAEKDDDTHSKSIGANNAGTENANDNDADDNNSDDNNPDDNNPDDNNMDGNNMDGNNMDVENADDNNTSDEIDADEVEGMLNGNNEDSEQNNGKDDAVTANNVDEDGDDDESGDDDEDDEEQRPAKRKRQDQSIEEN